MAQTFDMIYKDLDDAIALYQGANIKREAKFQPDLSIAYGVYARTALTKNDWPKAQEMARKAREGYVRSWMPPLIRAVSMKTMMTLCGFRRPRSLMSTIGHGAAILRPTDCMSRTGSLVAAQSI